MNSIINGGSAFFCPIVGLLALTGIAGVHAATLNDGGITKLEVVARDGGGANQIENLSPTSLPFNGSHVATQSGSHSQATYHLGSDEFTITSSGNRSGSLDSRANVQPVIFFSMSVDTRYSISGTFSVDDPGSSAKYAEFTTTLTDLNTSATLFHSSQASRGVDDTSFVLGGSAGNRINQLTGSAAGILAAGHQYRLYYGSSIYADNSGDPASFVGNFRMELQPISNPSGNLILNGGFEFPQITTNSFLIANATGWEGNRSRIVNGTYGAPEFPGPFGGQQVANVGNDGVQATLSQSFLVPTAGPNHYLLTWNDATGANPGATSPYSVTVTDNSGASVFSRSFTANGNAPGWRKQSAELTLNPGMHTLVFQSLQQPHGNSTFLDDVSLLPDLRDLQTDIRCASVSVCWPGRTNQLYQVQFKEDLTEPHWTNLGSAVIGTTTNCFIDPVTDGVRRFYQVVRVP